MDIFKGIGDFFGGLFGQKKKREDEQPQPQQQQSAVSFNSTPKLGDNFANNSSNPTQPQQPKEFAKSSVDLNPVKPVQPVQPQVNRDQERQQLANQYRQEETDRYNQGSDHVANFFNDIFSGGKTAQMRENTINQNIQNRVNAEMLRKYGPDDQQVKQNIAQTSQDINNNATSVNDFTKNYNNTVQQTVTSPVSAVKGAANSVVETMPKVSGAVTELGANTIKLFDEDNQFANNLIDRVRADREKNVVRKTLNSATGLTDQDNKMAYGLGSSGTRMAIDAAMTPVTGGVAPALVHGVEAHSDMMDSLDNIEARKKAEAAAKGEAYTPSSFGSRYLASTANAGAQAAIEKLGIDNVTGKIGGKFAKNMVGRAITGALGEAGEEAAQQYAENFTKKLFDNKQNIHEGVAESALMGGIMGGAGKMAFGGMDAVKNPYDANNGKFNNYNPKSLIEAERNAVRTGIFNKNNANSDLSLADAEFNVGAPERLSKALRNGADGDVSFMRMPNRLLGEVNTIRQNIGQNPLKTNEITAYKNAVNNHLNKRVLEGMSPETAAYIAADSFINPYSKALPVDNNGAYDRNHIQMAAGGNHAGKYNTTTFSQFGDNISLKNITPRKSAEIKNLLQRREEILSGSSDGGAGVVPSSTNVGGAPFSAGRATYTNNIAQNGQKVNDTKTIYNSNIRKAPDLVSYDANGNDTELKSNAYGSNIAQNTQKVNTFNREYEPEIQDLQNAYQKYGDDFEFNLTPEQQAVYEHLLRESPRDNEGRYIDPATGEMTIDQTVNRNESTNPYAQNNQHTTFAGDRDFVGRDFRGENSQVNKTADDNVKYKLSPEQEEFFKDSKIRDEDGNLRTVYHGTDVNFDTFDKDKAGNGWLGKGFYFTPDEDVARSFGKKINENYINVKNPFVVEGHNPTDVYSEITAKYPEANEFNMSEVLANHGYDGIQFNHWDKGEMITAFEPNQVKYTNNLNPTDSADMRFKQKAEAENLARVAKENLQARHQELTGDQSIAFNEWANELERRAQGFFDEKTGKITINDGDLNTLNHELGHKLLTRADNRAELLADIRNTVGDEALNAKYGENYAQQAANMNPEERANLFAEEYLADGFSDYYNGILAGEDSQRLGAKLGIPPRVLATYDRIMEAIKGILGLQQDTLKQFYAQAETGKFAQNYKQNTSIYNESPAYKIAQDSKGDLVEIDQNIFEGVPRNERAKTLRKYLQQNLQGNEYGLDYDRDGNVRITKDSTHKIANPRQNAFTLGKKGEMISELPDILTISQKTGWAPDGKDHSFARDGFEYRQSRVKLGDEVYTVNLNVGLSQNGKVLYEINGIKKEPPITGANSSFESSDSFNTNSIAQNGNNVNAVDSENRYLLNSTPEINQKTRKFAETVLDTDTPPKDFVKLMHAGDESLKYTPKKNSEMWSRATKSVQESPERVFNELENTRVANDETMAKGIALAKHYQAMGDDLKASELYVELAKKATEAGRTVQALNLMRRTTPEGVLMSTMREVESYNDKMKNKPNKQINITPEQRAEFLGKLREAYAMPEGN